MARKMYMISVRWKSDSRADDLQKKLPGSWLRFNTHLWLLKSESLSSEVFDKIDTELLEIDDIIIMEVDPDTRYGWAETWIWDWIDKP